MAGNALEIKVEAETGDAEKAFDELGQSIEKIEESTDKAAKATQKWSSYADDLKRAGLKSSDAKPVQQVAQATLTASSAAAVAQTNFQKLSYSVRQMGSNALAAMRGGFGNMMSGLANFGRNAARGLAAGFRVGLGALAGINLATILGRMMEKAFHAMIFQAREAGKAFMEAYTGAFESGIDLSTFNKLAGMFDDVLKPEAVNELAKSFGELQRVFKKGGDDAEQLLAIGKLLGVNFETLAKGGAASATEMKKLYDAMSSMSTLQKSEFLTQVLGIDPKAAAALVLEMERNTDALKKNADAWKENAAERDAADAKNRASGEAWDKLTTSLNNVWTAFDNMAHLSDPWVALGDPANLEAMAAGLEEFAAFLRSIPSQVQQAVSDMKAMFVDLAAAISAEVEKIPGIVSDAFSQAKDAAVQWANDLKESVVGIFKAAVAEIKAVWEGITSFITSGIDAAMKKVNGFIELLKTAASYIPGLGSSAAPQAVPQVIPQGMLLRATPSALAYGLVGPSTQAAAANDNKGGWANSKALDGLIFQYKEVSKAAKKAADDVSASSAKMNEQTVDPLLGTIAKAGDALKEFAFGAIEMVEPWREWAQAQLDLNAALAAGLISIEQYQAAWARMKADLDTSPMATAVADLKQGFESLAQSAASSLVDAIVDGKDLTEVFKGLLKQMIKMVIEAMILKPLMNSLFGGAGGGGLFSAVGLSASSMAPQTAGLQAGLRAANDVSGFSNIRGRASISDSGKAAKGGGGVTNQIGNINIDMSQTGLVTADEKDGKKMGLEIQRAVQAVLVQESRPGGLLRKAA